MKIEREVIRARIEGDAALFFLLGKLEKIAYKPWLPSHQQDCIPASVKKLPEDAYQVDIILKHKITGGDYIES